eukprot:5357387-Amphidinium_carterae.1
MSEITTRMRVGGATSLRSTYPNRTRTDSRLSRLLANSRFGVAHYTHSACGRPTSVGRRPVPCRRPWVL